MKTILILAEDETIRETLKTALSNHTPLIVTEDVKQCLHVLSQKTTIDQMILGVSGLKPSACEKTLSQILKVRPTIKVIAMGNKKDEELATSAVRFGAHGYMILPVKAETLLSTMRL